MIVYLNGEVIDREQARISPDDRGFVFGDGVYEVIRVYDGRMFAPEAHIDRMRRSLTAMRIDPDVTDGLPSIANELIKRNGLTAGDATVYLQVTRGVAPRKHPFPPSDTKPTVYATAKSFDPPRTEWENGVGAILVPDIRWSRCDVKTTSLVPNVMAAQKARAAGVFEGLFVRDGVVLEGSHTNFCAVLDGTLQTAPRSNYILAGITRETVLGLCADESIPVREFPVFQSDLPHASEMMLLGTTTEVMPVIEIDGRPVGDGRPGPVTRRLQAAFSRRTSQAAG